jgi:hypothetical protein
VGRVQMSDGQLYPNDNSARKSDSPTTTTQTIKSYIYWVLKMFLVAKFFPIFLSFLNFESFRNIFEACPTQNCNYAMFQFSYYLYAKLLTFKIFNKKNQPEILKMKINKAQFKLFEQDLVS